MCILNIKEYMQADGRREIIEGRILCHNAVGNQLCNDVRTRRHGPTRLVEVRPKLSSSDSRESVVVVGRDGKERRYRDIRRTAYGGEGKPVISQPIPPPRTRDSRDFIGLDRSFKRPRSTKVDYEDDSDADDVLPPRASQVDKASDYADSTTTVPVSMRQKLPSMRHLGTDIVDSAVGGLGNAGLTEANNKLQLKHRKEREDLQDHSSQQVKLTEDQTRGQPVLERERLQTKLEEKRTKGAMNEPGRVAPNDMQTLMSGLNGALRGQQSTLTKFDEQDEMIRKMGRGKADIGSPDGSLEVDNDLGDDEDLGTYRRDSHDGEGEIRLDESEKPQARQAQAETTSHADNDQGPGLAKPDERVYDFEQDFDRLRSAHFENNDSRVRHKCPYCAAEFQRHHNLKSHLLAHSQEKPYICQDCQMRFRRPEDLKRHARLHTGDRPHVCDACGRRFARGDALNRHRSGLGGCASRREELPTHDNPGHNDHHNWASIETELDDESVVDAGMRKEELPKVSVNRSTSTDPDGTNKAASAFIDHQSDTNNEKRQQEINKSGQRYSDNVVVEELAEDDAGYVSNIDVVYPEELEEISSSDSGNEDSSTNNSDDSEAPDLARRLSALHTGDDQEAGLQEFRRRKLTLDKRNKQNQFKRLHSQSIEDDAENTDPEVLGDHDLASSQRRLRRRVREDQSSADFGPLKESTEAQGDMLGAADLPGSSADRITSSSFEIQNQPGSILHIENLPRDPNEEELKAIFSKQHGYRRLCIRTKPSIALCFAEFESTRDAENALANLHGCSLSNSVNGGIRLSFTRDQPTSRTGFTPIAPLEDAGDDSEDVDSEAASVYAESVFSEASIATSVSSVASYEVSDALIRNFATALFCKDDLAIIHAAAFEDSDIGADRLRRNLRRLIAKYGSLLKLETNTSIERSAARLLHSRNISTRAAQEVIDQTERLGKSDVSSRPRRTGVPNLNIDEQSDESGVESDADVAASDLLENRFDDIRCFLLQSRAYASFRSELLRFAHKPYEARILQAIGREFRGEHGSQTISDTGKALVRELAWVPPVKIGFLAHVALRPMDYMKTWTEKVIGETWDWRPLSQPNRALPDGCIRVTWKSPAGATRYCDLQTRYADALRATLTSAPAFLAVPDSLLLPRGGRSGFSTLRRLKLRGQSSELVWTHIILTCETMTSAIDRIYSTPIYKTFQERRFRSCCCFGILASILLFGLRGSLRADLGWALILGMPLGGAIYMLVGIKLALSGATQKQDHQSAVQPPTGTHTSGNHPTPHSTGTAAPIAHTPCGHSHGSGPTTVGTQDACSSCPSSPLDPRHLYLCIKTASRHHFTALPIHEMKTDIDFFSALKKTYLSSRPLYRRWLSMYRYSHCDFFQFVKYARNTGAPTQVSFPSASNTDYEFDPRPVEPQPPIGPITEDEFRDRFYLSCESCHSWHQHQLQRLLFNQHDCDALKALPKRKQALEMGDGKREVFWGIYVRERRSFAVVCFYASLCVVVPWVIFGFLWLFKWGHAGDLQNASVPISVSVSVAMFYAALLYESREGNGARK